MPRTVKPMAFWAGLSKLRRMARSRPGNDVVLAYAKRLFSETDSWDELSVLKAVCNQCGLSVTWSKELPGTGIRCPTGIKWQLPEVDHV